MHVGHVYILDSFCNKGRQFLMAISISVTEAKVDGKGWKRMELPNQTPLPCITHSEHRRLTKYLFLSIRLRTYLLFMLLYSLAEQKRGSIVRALISLSLSLYLTLPGPL